jgi:hypothetical protein
MKLLIGNETFNFESKDNRVELIMEKIAQVNRNSHTALSHILVDGVEVYDQLEDYLTEHSLSINVVEAIIKPIKELVHDLLLSAEEYIIRGLPELRNLIDQFYQGPEKETWNHFNELLIGIQWVYQLIKTVDQGAYHPKNWSQYLISMNTVQERLQNLEEAILGNDSILIGDILLYEILPEFENLRNELGTSIDHEGKRNNVN